MSKKTEVEWPADRLERRPIESLIPYVFNAKTHPDDQIARIVESMKTWGWTIPCLISEDGSIIAGHGRILAAKKMGLKEAPCLVAVGWSQEMKDAYCIADNQLTVSPWDKDLLSKNVKSLMERDFDLRLLGFNEQELTGLLVHATPIGLTDPDVAPGLPENPITVEGDVWVLQSGYGLTHRIICGDCTDGSVVGAVLGDIRPHLMVTDPPYGVNYDASWRNAVIRENGTRVGARAIGKVQNDDRADWHEAWALFPGFVAYVWHGALQSSTVQHSLEVAGFAVRSQIVWIKSQFVISRGNYHGQHEPAYFAVRGDNDHWNERYAEEHELAAYAVKKGGTAAWEGGRKQSTVWMIDKPQKSETGHSTQKPVECMARPIRNNSSAGQAVYEPFCGSGTTIIAGEMYGRAVLACELSPQYVDISVSRWCRFTGRKAVRESDGFVWDGVYQEQAVERKTE